MTAVAERIAPAIEPTLFRQLLSCFPKGVAVITTRNAEGRPVGLTCNSFAWSATSPPPGCSHQVN